MKPPRWFLPAWCHPNCITHGTVKSIHLLPKSGWFFPIIGIFCYQVLKQFWLLTINLRMTTEICLGQSNFNSVLPVYSAPFQFQRYSRLEARLYGHLVFPVKSCSFCPKRSTGVSKLWSVDSFCISVDEKNGFYRFKELEKNQYFMTPKMSVSINTYGTQSCSFL